MKRISAAVLLLLIVSFSYAQPNEETEVKKTFDDYKSAILNDDGNSAVELVDSRTRNYYSTILDLVKNGDSASIDAASLVDKVTVFSIRHRASKEEIRKMDGRRIFIYAIEKGMVGKDGVVGSSMGEVTISGNFAKGQLVVNGQPTPLSFHFYKEDGEWKIDLTSLFPLTNTFFKQMVKESGQEENPYIFSLIELLTGRPIGPEIWETID